MKVGIYTPYLDTLGGGERYILTIAEYLARMHSVDLLLDDKLPQWPGEKWKQKIQDRLGIDLRLVGVREGYINREGFQTEARRLFSEYDAFFYMTDGTLFHCSAANAFLLIQKPGMLHNVRGTSPRSFPVSLLRSWNNTVCYSIFTKTLLDQEWGINARVLYPPVDVGAFRPIEKKNIILSVGRFFRGDHCKKQHVLVNAFRELYDNGLRGWSLYLVGGVREKGETYLECVQDLSKGMPIEILTNTPFSTLRSLYGQASLYWHGTGFGEDPIRHPDRMEHFGITTVEAMAAGCVPIAMCGGGQPEIIVDAQSGFLWNDLTELKKYTMQLILDEDLRVNMGKQAIVRSRQFDKKRFCTEVEALLDAHN